MMMATALDIRDREILEHLQRAVGSDVQELCELLGVTRTAIRHRLSRLRAMGLVATGQQGQLRGRPRNVYRVTSDGIHALGENYRQLAVVLWETVIGFEDPQVREALICRVKTALVSRFQQETSEQLGVDERVDRLAEEMKASGFNVESDHREGLHILRETSCPFPLLADMGEAICQMERQVVEEVLGASVEFRSRCRDGQGCCEFQVSSVGAEAS